MRVSLGLVAVIALGVLAGGCSETPGGSATGGSDSSSSNPLEAALRACADSSAAVYDAMQGSDMSAATASLEAAKASCHSAAQALRQTPLPGEDNAALERSFDQMASGLGRVEDGVRHLNASPARARREAQEGMRIYKAGLTLLESVHHNGG